MQIILLGFLKELIGIYHNLCAVRKGERPDVPWIKTVTLIEDPEHHKFTNQCEGL